MSLEELIIEAVKDAAKSRPKKLVIIFNQSETPSFTHIPSPWWIRKLWLVFLGSRRQTLKGLDCEGRLLRISVTSDMLDVFSDSIVFSEKLELFIRSVRSASLNMYTPTTVHLAAEYLRSLGYLPEVFECHHLYSGLGETSKHEILQQGEAVA